MLEFWKEIAHTEITDRIIVFPINIDENISNMILSTAYYVQYRYKDFQVPFLILASVVEWLCPIN